MDGSNNGTFGARLENELKRQGYSRARFVRETGISEMSLGEYIRGRRYPGFANLKTICEKLDVSADWFIWGDDQIG